MYKYYWVIIGGFVIVIIFITNLYCCQKTIENNNKKLEPVCSRTGMKELIGSCKILTDSIQNLKWDYNSTLLKLLKDYL